MRFYAAARVGVPTTTLPAPSLISATSKAGLIRTIEAFNTTTTAEHIALRRFSTAGTPGSTINSGSYPVLEDGSVIAPALTLKDLFTSTAPTLVNGIIRAAPLGATIGWGVMWTFGEQGIMVPRTSSGGTAHVGILSATGTAQVNDVAFEWDE